MAVDFHARLRFPRAGVGLAGVFVLPSNQLLEELKTNRTTLIITKKNEPLIKNLDQSMVHFLLHLNLKQLKTLSL